MIVVVDVVDLALGAHDATHLLQQDPIVSLNRRQTLFLKLMRFDELTRSVAVETHKMEAALSNKQNYRTPIRVRPESSSSSCADACTPGAGACRLWAWRRAP